LLANVPFGTWNYKVNNTSGGTLQHRFEPLVPTGTFQLNRNSRFTLSAQYRQTTGQVDFEALDLPASATGNFGSIAGPGGTYPLNLPKLSYALDPGNYTATFTGADPAGYDWKPQAGSQQFAVAAGLAYKLEARYTASRGRVEILTDLPQGASAQSTIVGGGMTRSPMIPGSWFYAPGPYTLEPGDAFDVPNTNLDRFEDFSPIQPMLNFDISAGLNTSLNVNYQLDGWNAEDDIQWSVKFDPQFHHMHLGSLRVSRVNFDVRVTDAGASGAGAASASTLAILGPAPWIPLNGTLEDDGTFTASGTGTVVGYSNVPLTFTGTLSATGQLNGELVIGSDTPPHGLPNGSITYTITGTRVPLQANR
jgi:hypothetical protein